jgi:hypothetical protein
VLQGTRRVKERPFNLPLLVKPNEPISGIRLSSGISHSRKRNSYTDNSARFGLQQLFDNLHDLCQLAFSLTLFSGLPFWYVTIRLLLSCCQPLLYPDQNPFAGSGFPSIQSPPVPCGTGSVYHQPVLHRYYGFIRPLLTHCFCFPIQVILRLPLPLQLGSLTQKRVEC